MKRIAAIINAIMTALAFGFLLKAEPSFAANNEEQTEYKLSRSEITLELGGTGYDIKITPKSTTQPKYDYSNSKEYLSIDSVGHITAIGQTNERQEIKVVIGSDTLTFFVNKINDNARISKIISIIKQDFRSQINEFNKEIENLRSQITDLTKKESHDNEGETHDKNTTLFITIIASLGVLLVISIIVLICLYSNNKEKDLRIHNLNDTIHRSKKDDDLNGKNLRINNLERENQKLRNRVSDLEDLCYIMQQNVKEIHENAEIKAEPATDRASSNIKDDENAPKQKQTTRLYSDAIINDILNKVNERPNDDTIFELILNGQDSTSAKVTIYSGAKRRIIANASFLEGCEKQIIGNNDVVVEREGTAEKNSTTGVWNLIKCPKVVIK
ncbi:MAG: hypothetical protein MJZ90_00485 [Bacteroidales bacterium]|nr:hypothetical protein [Bacteroidales bacterium]